MLRLRTKAGNGLHDIDALSTAEVDAQALYDNAGDEPILSEGGKHP